MIQWRMEVQLLLLNISYSLLLLTYCHVCAVHVLLHCTNAKTFLAVSLAQGIASQTILILKVQSLIGVENTFHSITRT